MARARENIPSLKHGSMFHGTWSARLGINRSRLCRLYTNACIVWVCIGYSKNNKACSN